MSAETRVRNFWGRYYVDIGQEDITSAQQVSYEDDVYPRIKAILTFIDEILDGGGTVVSMDSAQTHGHDCRIVRVYYRRGGQS